MPRSRRFRRRALSPFLPLAAGVVAVAAVGAAVLAHGGTPTFQTAADSGAALTASYQSLDSWGTGYTGQYTTTNSGASTVSGWSAGRDQECPGGAQPSAEPTCSSIVQSPNAFMTALGGY